MGQWNSFIKVTKPLTNGIRRQKLVRCIIFHKWGTLTYFMSLALTGKVNSVRWAFSWRVLRTGAGAAAGPGHSIAAQLYVKGKLALGSTVAARILNSCCCSRVPGVLQTLLNIQWIENQLMVAELWNWSVDTQAQGGIAHKSYNEAAAQELQWRVTMKSILRCTYWIYTMECYLLLLKRKAIPTQATIRMSSKDIMFNEISQTQRIKHWLYIRRTPGVKSTGADHKLCVVSSYVGRGRERGTCIKRWFQRLEGWLSTDYSSRRRGFNSQHL